MPKLQDRHLAHLHRDRYAPGTIRERARVLASLPLDPLSLSRDAMGAWWETRQTTRTGHPRAASSLAAERSHVRAFYAWAIAAELIDHNPGDWLPRVRQKSPAPRPTREGDLASAYSDANPAMRMMLALGAMAGLRSAEIASIRWDDLDSASGILTVRNGKGGKDRTVPLSDSLIEALGQPGRGPIVTNSAGGPLTAKAVSSRIGRFLRSHGVRSSAHKLRARYATRFLAETGDLEATRAVLGHASVATTQRYVIASSDVMKRGARAAGRIG